MIFVQIFWSNLTFVQKFFPQNFKFSPNLSFSRKILSQKKYRFFYKIFRLFQKFSIKNIFFHKIVINSLFTVDFFFAFPIVSFAEFFFECGAEVEARANTIYFGHVMNTGGFSSLYGSPASIRLLLTFAFFKNLNFNGPMGGERF